MLIEELLTEEEKAIIQGVRESMKELDEQLKETDELIKSLGDKYENLSRMQTMV